MTSKRFQERLIALFVVGVLAINYPILHLFGEGAMWMGVPILYLYLFFCWLLLIVFLALLLERRHGTDRDSLGHSPGHK